MRSFTSLHDASIGLTCFLDPEPKLKTNSRYLSKGGSVSVSLDSEMLVLTSFNGSTCTIYTLGLCAYMEFELESVCLNGCVNVLLNTGNRVWLMVPPAIVNTFSHTRWKLSCRNYAKVEIIYWVNKLFLFHSLPVPQIGQIKYKT